MRPQPGTVPRTGQKTDNTCALGGAHGNLLRFPHQRLEDRVLRGLLADPREK